MRFVRFGSEKDAKIGAIKGDAVVDLVAAGSRWTRIVDIAKEGEAAVRELQKLTDEAATAIPLTDVSLLAPIERPGKYMAIGMNYAKHVQEAKEHGVDIPEYQVWFNKQTSCVSGPFDDIDPGLTEKLDYEVELGVVIGAPAKYVSKDYAKNHVFGYFVANDVSARDYQFHSKTFTIGKSFDTHGPIGPYIVTADEIADPHNLDLRCLVNGETRQDNNTKNMIFNIWDQISYLSSAFTLDTGDLIATGTPEGVGIAMKPPQFLNPGDVIRCEVDGVGVIENKVVESSAR